MSENEVQNSILEFLKFKGVMAWRNNNGSVFDAKRGQHRRKNKWEIVYGTPVDISGMLKPNGRRLEIEVKKNEKEKMSPGQVEFCDNINKDGGLAFKAYSIRCVKIALAEYLD